MSDVTLVSVFDSCSDADFFISALHRVSVPTPEKVPPTGLAARYSIPFFVAPAPSQNIATLPRFLAEGHTAKYDPVKFEDYGAMISKYQYEGE